MRTPVVAAGSGQSLRAGDTEEQDTDQHGFHGSRI